MATGTDLRDLVGDDGARGSGGLDAHAVIRAARRRRLPRQIAVGGAMALAVIAIAVPAALIAPALLPSTTSAGSSAGGAQQDRGEGVSGGDAATCAPVATAGVSDAGLAVTASFPAASSGARAVDGTVSIRNSGTTTITGWIGAPPTVVLRRDGEPAAIAVGSAPRSGTRIELEPGQTLDYPVTLPLVGCADPQSALPPGSYSVTATISVGTSAPGTTTTDSGASSLVGGGTSALTVG